MIDVAIEQEEETGGRRSRKSVVNYAQPKLNTYVPPPVSLSVSRIDVDVSNCRKMRRPQDYVPTISKPLPRKSLHQRGSSANASRESSVTSLPPPLPDYRHAQHSAEIEDPSAPAQEEEVVPEEPLVAEVRNGDSSEPESEEEVEEEEELAVISEYQKRNDRILAMLGPPERVVEVPTGRRESRRTSQAGY